MEDGGVAAHRPAVTRATTASTDAMIRCFCTAFADDPGLAWIWPDRADRLPRLAHFFAAIVGGTLDNGLALAAGAPEGDARDTDVIAASLWRLPSRIRPGPGEIGRVQHHLTAAFSRGADRSHAMSAALGARHPTGFDYWYLQFVGVRPSAQGAGIGGAIVRAGLDAASAVGMPVYVEVMNPANLPFYLRLGFAPLADFALPDGGPHVWTMLGK